MSRPVLFISLTLGRLLSVSVCVSVCVCVCVSWGWQDRAKSETRLSSPVPDQQLSCPCLSFVISWFSNSTFLICLFEPWRRRPCAGMPSPRRAGRRIRVGLPTPAKSQKMDRGTLPWCSLPSNSSHPRAASHSLNNRTSKLANERSQPIL